MEKAIDVRDMHTAIHNLFWVRRKPKTTLKLFEVLETCDDEAICQDIWNMITENVDWLGEFNFRDISADRVVQFKGEKYQIIHPHHFDIYGV